MTHAFNNQRRRTRTRTGDARTTLVCQSRIAKNKFNSPFPEAGAAANSKSELSLRIVRVLIKRICELVSSLEFGYGGFPHSRNLECRKLPLIVTDLGALSHQRHSDFCHEVQIIRPTVAEYWMSVALWIRATCVLSHPIEPANLAVLQVKCGGNLQLSPDATLHCRK